MELCGRRRGRKRREREREDGVEGREKKEEEEGGKELFMLGSHSGREAFPAAAGERSGYEGRFWRASCKSALPPPAV